MKALHEVRPAMPHGDHPLLTREALRDTGRREWSGTLRDAWWVGEETVGLWEHPETNVSYLVRITGDYPHNAMGREWIGQDLRAIRSPGGQRWYVSDGYTFTAPPEGEVQTFEVAL